MNEKPPMNPSLDALRDEIVSERAAEAPQSKEEQAETLRAQIETLKSDENMSPMLRDLRIKTAEDKLADLEGKE